MRNDEQPPFFLTNILIICGKRIKNIVCYKGVKVIANPWRLVLTRLQ